jgi:hypothetical protein
VTARDPRCPARKVGTVLLLTTLDAWRADPDQPFRSETAAYSP